MDLSHALSFLDGKRAEMTATLRDWCAINSGSRNLEGLAAMRAALAEAFAALGAAPEAVPARPYEVVTESGEIVKETVGDCLRLVKRPQAPVRVLLAGHMDTVFGADHPFQSDRYLDEDVLNAPGGADMKGGLLVMLYALRAVENSPLAERIGYEVVINADEEIGSHGSAHILTDAARRAHFACVYEPALADGTLAGARKGSGNFAAVFTGRSAHAGREHHLGRNAVVAAAEFMTRIDALSGRREGLTVNVARLDGGGPDNVVPDRAVARFNVRVEQPEDAEWFLREAERLIAEIDARAGYGARLHGGFGRPPKPMTPRLQAFFEALKGVGAELGLDIAWKPTGGCCDGNNIAAAGIPVIDTLGVRGANIHSAEEYVRLDSLEERAKLSALLLLRVAAGDIPNPGAQPEAETAR
ncbi:hydrolase [Amphiplicatus metriothermophilus]|uniref:Glutamate carboxypeptidase n=1 Tax=Amphiplicatus metriothermophilus TaxID=1519374 RepID=A0A239PVL5_9PROT|nr:hydrolase [Amphiplicatus metriothermophilus]MBB5519506.1 glutamate carboxypeptidase [Amphiplicatus metriothermophilus]SNT74073.1 glutamate carboxypeptidase [Amphiplicatus metriothermophilus]